MTNVNKYIKSYSSHFIAVAIWHLCVKLLVMTNLNSRETQGDQGCDPVKNVTIHVSHDNHNSVHMRRCCMMMPWSGCSLKRRTYGLEYDATLQYFLYTNSVIHAKPATFHQLPENVIRLWCGFKKKTNKQKMQRLLQRFNKRRPQVGKCWICLFIGSNGATSNHLFI